MLSEQAVTLLRLAGHTGSVPGVLQGVTLLVAGERLKDVLEVATPNYPRPVGDESPTATIGERAAWAANGDAERAIDEPSQFLKLRASPLLKILNQGITHRVPVYWHYQ